MTHGAFVVSLDFEKHWGVFDHVSGPEDAYWKNLEAVDQVVPKLLETFSNYAIHVTWSTVGMLFARNRDEQNSWRPKVIPAYSDPSLNPYSVAVGNDPSVDKVHFAPDLIQAIAATPGQEIGTHTFGHVYALAPGMTAEAFDHDLAAAVIAGQSLRIRQRSIVFPRNQYRPDFRAVLMKNGIDSYRGNPVYWPYNARRGGGMANKMVRLGRLVDSYLSDPRKNTQAWSELDGGDGMVNVRASHFLRPYSTRFSALSTIHVKMIRQAVRYAARNKRLYHLWWHPHNFGQNTDTNMNLLSEILSEVSACREKFGMQSLNMSEVADTFRRSTC